jgi:hypothetical protein
LTGLVDAYVDRRRRELLELGRVVNLAVVDPEKLNELAKPAPSDSPVADDGEYVEKYW